MNVNFKKSQKSYFYVPENFEINQPCTYCFDTFSCEKLIKCKFELMPVLYGRAYQILGKIILPY
jgi:hypothetical protein